MWHTWTPKSRCHQCNFCLSLSNRYCKVQSIFLHLKGCSQYFYLQDVTSCQQISDFSHSSGEHICGSSDPLCIRNVSAQADTVILSASCPTVSFDMTGVFQTVLMYVLKFGGMGAVDKRAKLQSLTRSIPERTECCCPEQPPLYEP